MEEEVGIEVLRKNIYMVFFFTFMFYNLLFYISHRSFHSICGDYLALFRLRVIIINYIYI